MISPARPNPDRTALELAYGAGRLRGRYEALRAKASRSPRRKSSVEDARRMAEFRREAQEIEARIALDVPWPKEAA